MGVVTPYRNNMNYYTGTGAGVLKPGTIVKQGGYTGADSILGTSTGTGVYQDTGQLVDPASGNDAPRIDPYAQWGGRAAYDSKINAFNTQKQGIFDTANEAVDSSGRSLNSSILDFLGSYKQGQNTINEKAITADQAKITGGRDILSMVGRGIRSAGVNLANKNASDSSATEGVARAYGDVGQREMNKVGGQYADAQRGIATDQQNLADSAALFNRKYEDNKVGAVEGIVSSARNSLAALDAAIADASLPQRIQIEQEKERIRGDALGKLSQYDQVLSSGIGGVKALTQEDRLAQANQRSIEGINLGSNAFQYDTQAPAQFQNTGPYASNLPLFTLAGRRKEV